MNPHPLLPLTAENALQLPHPSPLLLLSSFLHPSASDTLLPTVLTRQLANVSLPFAVMDLFLLPQGNEGSRVFQLSPGLKLQRLHLVLPENIPAQERLSASLPSMDQCYCFCSWLCFQSRGEEDNILRVA